MIEIKLNRIVRQTWRIKLLIFQLNTVNLYTVLKKGEAIGQCVEMEAEADLFVQKTVSSSLVAEAASRAVRILEAGPHSGDQAEEGRESQEPARQSHCDENITT